MGSAGDHRTIESAPHRPVEEAEPTVLVAEDDAVVRSLLVSVLRELGYTVLEAADGVGVLRLAREHPGPIDLLVADVAMQDVAGPAVVGALRQLRPEMRLLFLSGHPPEAAGDVAGLPHGVAFLEKPCTAVTLSDKLLEVLDPRD
jgi:CheY-like chemotaxis protein